MIDGGTLLGLVLLAVVILILARGASRESRLVEILPPEPEPSRPYDWQIDGTGDDSDRFLGYSSSVTTLEGVGDRAAAE